MAAHRAWAVILKMLQAFAEATGAIVWQVGVDSTIMRAHQHAAGARRDPGRQAGPPDGSGEEEPGDQALGRSRGGWTTKLHPACEDHCPVMGMLPTAGQAVDSLCFATVLDRIEVPRPATGPAARNGCSPTRPTPAAATAPGCVGTGIKATIPVPSDQVAHRRARGRAGGRPPAFDPILYRDRNTIARGINQLEQRRAVATRFDKLAVRYLATTHIAAVNQWLRHE